MAENLVAQITCPSCGRGIPPQNRYCDYCGIDLATAVGLVEQAFILPDAIPVGMPLAPELLVPRVGEYMIEQGMITAKELHQALEHQKELAKNGSSILLGQALLELGFINRETLDQVITTQILKLQFALSEANQHLSKRVEERTHELQQALERLSELSQLKSNFIANISHELRTPLTHIKGYLDILSDGSLGPLTKSQSEALSVIIRADERLEQLIEDLIQFSLASRGELSIRPRPTKLDALINDVLERSTQKAQKKRISLTASLPKHLPEVRADEDKISWVLLQLLDNALKFTPDHGKVRVQSSVESGVITTAVMDTGIGIPEKRFAEIFEPFHQLDGNSTRRYAGTGLGLAMVRRIIEAHGSQVIVQSVVGQGSKFEFSLPVARSDKVT